MSSERSDGGVDRGRERAEAQRRAHPSRDERIDARDTRRAERQHGAEPRELLWTRPEPGTRRARLTRDEIATTGLRIADADGLEALSMRRVAAELGAGTMTLYYYVRNKEELLDLMQDAMMGEVLVPESEPPDDWRVALTAIAHRSRDTYLRHRWALGAPPRAAGPNGMRHFEQLLAAVAGLEVDLQIRLDAVLMLDDFVFGLVFRESKQAGEQASQLNDERRRDTMTDYYASLVAGGGFPNLAQLLADSGGQTVQERLERAVGKPGRFERDLQRVLDGIALDLDAARRAGPNRRGSDA